MVFILPAAPPGSDTYDKRMCQNLPAVGQPVLELPIAGGWPEPTTVSRFLLRRMSGAWLGSLEWTSSTLRAPVRADASAKTTSRFTPNYY